MRLAVVVGASLLLGGCALGPVGWGAVGAGLGYAASVNNGIVEWFRWNEPAKEAPRP